jgi:hypothetical protein
VTDLGLETEAALEGTIHSFTTTGVTAQPLSFEAGTDLVVGAAARSYTFAGTASGNPVVLASSDAAMCTVAGHSVTPVAPGTCTLTASVGGNATYQPVSVTDAFVVSAATAPAPDLEQTPAPPTTPPGETPATPPTTPRPTSRPPCRSRHPEPPRRPRLPWCPRRSWHPWSPRRC